METATARRSRRRREFWEKLRHQMERFFFLLFTAVSVGLVSLTLYSLDQNARTQQDLKDNTIANCKEIEQLKAGERQKVWDEFNDLNKNLRLIGLKKTPEIVEASKARRDRELKRYAADPCPRKPIAG